MVDWRFGNPLSQGYQEEYQQGFIEVDPDAGIGFRREQFSDVNTIIRFNKLLTRAEAIDFKAFYINETRQGAIAFTYYDCELELNRTGRFVGKFTLPQQSNNYRLSCTISLDPVEYTQELLLAIHKGEVLTTYSDKVLMVRKEVIL